MKRKSNETFGYSLIENKKEKERKKNEMSLEEKVPLLLCT